MPVRNNFGGRRIGRGVAHVDGQEITDAIPLADEGKPIDVDEQLHDNLLESRLFDLYQT